MPLLHLPLLLTYIRIHTWIRPRVSHAIWVQSTFFDYRFTRDGHKAGGADPAHLPTTPRSGHFSGRLFSDWGALSAPLPTVPALA